MKQWLRRSTLILLVLSILFSIVGLSSKHVSAQLQDPIVSVIPAEPQTGQHAVVEAYIEIALC